MHHHQYMSPLTGSSSSSNTGSPTGAAVTANLPLIASIANVKDSRWLTLEVCREYQRGKCTRADQECKFAHPPSHVEVNSGKVIACFDSLKVSYENETAKKTVSSLEWYRNGWKDFFLSVSRMTLKSWLRTSTRYLSVKQANENEIDRLIIYLVVSRSCSLTIVDNEISSSNCSFAHRFEQNENEMCFVVIFFLLFILIIAEKWTR